MITETPRGTGNSSPERKLKEKLENIHLDNRVVIVCMTVATGGFTRVQLELLQETLSKQERPLPLQRIFQEARKRDENFPILPKDDKFFDHIGVSYPTPPEPLNFLPGKFYSLAEVQGGPWGSLFGDFYFLAGLPGEIAINGSSLQEELFLPTFSGKQTHNIFQTVFELKLLPLLRKGGLMIVTDDHGANLARLPSPRT